MLVRVENVVVFWYCKSHKDEQCQGNVQELWNNETPTCTECGKQLILKKECLITN